MASKSKFRKGSAKEIPVPMGYSLSKGGGTSFPNVLYNDYYDPGDFITALIDSGFAGVLWKTETPVSRSGVVEKDANSCVFLHGHAQGLVQWDQAWSFPEVEDQVRNVTLLRM